MENRVEKILKIGRDSDAINPRKEYDHLGTIVSCRSGYGDNQMTEEAFEELCSNPLIVGYWVGVYEHGMVAFHIGGVVSGDDDIEEKTMIYCRKDKAIAEFGEDYTEGLVRCFKAELQEYEDYCNGRVYYGEMTEREVITIDGKDYVGEIEYIDSCGGIYCCEGQEPEDAVLECMGWKREDFTKILNNCDR